MFDLIDLVGKQEFTKDDLFRILHRNNFEIPDAINAILYADPHIPREKFDEAMQLANEYGWAIANIRNQ